MSARDLSCALALLLGIAAGPATASDEDALTLADLPAAPPEQASDWRIALEGAGGRASQRIGQPRVDGHRLSLDVAYDSNFAPGWRAVFASRLDWRWQTQDPRESKVNTLKEAYLSHQLNPTAIVDAGRINVRNGVGTGFNPTD